MRNRYQQHRLAFFPFLLMTLWGVIAACNSSGSLGNQPPSFEVFAQQFPQLTLPYSYTYDSLMSAVPDSLEINTPRQIRYVPDSVLFPNGDTTARVYAIGRGKSEDKQQQWLFLKTVSKEAKRVYALIYNSNDSLIIAKKVASREKGARNKTRTFKWTNNRLLNLYEKTDLGSGYVAYKREVYSLLGGGKLQLILTNNHQPQAGDN